MKKNNKNKKYENMKYHFFDQNHATQIFARIQVLYYAPKI